jgi:hypothetical protein
MDEYIRKAAEYIPPGLLSDMDEQTQANYGRFIQGQMGKFGAHRRPSPAQMQEMLLNSINSSRAQANAQQTQQMLGQIFNPAAPQGGSAPARPAPQPNDEIAQVISTAAQRHGVSPQALTMIAGLESGFNPNAQNPNSTAGGLFQFLDKTAAQYGLQNKADPEQSADAAARLLRDNQASLRRSLGREPTPAELYLAHQQGATGAARLLQNPDARAVDVVGERAVTLNGGDPNMTAGQFANMWMQKAAGAGQPAQGQQAPQPGPQGYDRSASADRYFQAARVFAAQGDPETAKKYYDIGIGLNPNPSSDVRDIEYLFGGSVAGTGQIGVGAVGDYRRSGQAQTNVNVNTGESQFGPITPGYERYQDESGAFRERPLPGSKAAQEVEAADRAGRVAQANTSRAGGVVVQNVGRALEILEGGGLFTAGRGARVALLDPQSKASTLQNLIKDIQGNIGVDQLQQMRNASPTGGALGNVTERQLDMLTGLLGRLDITGDPKVLDDNLKRIANQYMDLVNGTPEQIDLMIQEMGLPPEVAEQLKFRYELSFDEMGRPIKKSTDGFSIRRRN